MPFRMSSDSSTLMPLYATPRWSRIWTTWPENPHIGNCGVPFMNSTTSLDFTSLLMNWSMAIDCVLVSGAGSRTRRFEAVYIAGFRPTQPRPGLVQPAGPPLDAIAAEGALERADHRVGRIRRQILVAAFATGSQLEHVVLLTGYL